MLVLFWGRACCPHLFLGACRARFFWGRACSLCFGGVLFSLLSGHAVFAVLPSFWGRAVLASFWVRACSGRFVLGACLQWSLRFGGVPGRSCFLLLHACWSGSFWSVPAVLASIWGRTCRSRFFLVACRARFVGNKPAVLAFLCERAKRAPYFWVRACRARFLLGEWQPWPYILAFLNSPALPPSTLEGCVLSSHEATSQGTGCQLSPFWGGMLPAVAVFLCCVRATSSPTIGNFWCSVPSASPYLFQFLGYVP